MGQEAFPHVGKYNHMTIHFTTKPTFSKHGFKQCSFFPINQILQMAVKRSYLNRYRTRNLLNRYVVLVLVWNWIVWVTAGTSTYTEGDVDLVSVVTLVQPYYLNNYREYIAYLLLVFFWIMAAFLSAWLAGWKYKLQSIVCIGMIVLGLGVLLDTALQTTVSATGSNENDLWVIVLTSLASILIAVGSGPCITSMLQLAMEQIPEASGSQLSSIVSWFIFSSVLGSWMKSFITGVYRHCVALSEEEHSKYFPILKLLFAAILTIALCTSALFNKSKLLDNSPSSGNIKLIYRVLKYAMHHKYPESRIAMALYNPSRLAYGKRKYGGPFTNEEVEDVRTFVQISALCLTSFLYLSSLYLNGYSLYYIDSNDYNHTLIPNKVTESKCTIFVLHSFTGYNTWWLLVSIPIYELILVPAFDFRIPSMLCRAGFVAVSAVLLSFFATTLIGIEFYSPKKYGIDLFWLKIALAIPIGVLKAVYYTACLEFICAQSPYTMRNFFMCIAQCIIGFSPLVSGMFFTLWQWKCIMKNCPIIYSGMALILSIAGLVLFCICAKCYRKRSRDCEEEKHFYVNDELNRKSSNTDSINIT